MEVLIARLFPLVLFLLSLIVLLSIILLLAPTLLETPKGITGIESISIKVYYSITRLKSVVLSLFYSILILGSISSRLDYGSLDLKEGYLSTTLLTSLVIILLVY